MNIKIFGSSFDIENTQSLKHVDVTIHRKLNIYDQISNRC